MKRTDFVQKSSILLIIILFFISISPAYAEWTIATFPNPDFRKIDFIDSNEGWALSVGSTLLHFSNGEWTTSELPDVDHGMRGLLDIQFISRDEGWAAGSIMEWSPEGNQSDQGALYHYVNGEWASVNLPNISTNWRLSSIQFFSPNEGWAAGSDFVNEVALLLQYTNGEWKKITVPVRDLWRTNFFFTSPDEGWVFSKGSILHYSNGEWKKSKIPLNWQISSVDFVSPDEAWAVGYRGSGSHHKGILLHYVNGRWRSVRTPKVSSAWDLMAVDFISPNEGWAVGSVTNSGISNGLLLHYLNGSWTSVDIPNLESFLLGAYFLDVQFLSNNEGWIAGYVIAERLVIGNRLNALLLKYSSP